jgi:hypothetical protein
MQSVIIGIFDKFLKGPMTITVITIIQLMWSNWPRGSLTSHHWVKVITLNDAMTQDTKEIVPLMLIIHYCFQITLRLYYKFCKDFLAL